MIIAMTMESWGGGLNPDEDPLFGGVRVKSIRSRAKTGSFLYVAAPPSKPSEEDPRYLTRVRAPYLHDE